MTRKKTRFLTVELAALAFLAAAIFAVLRGMPASAADWDGTAADSFTGGSGSEGEPYLVSNAGELAYFAQEVNSGTISKCCNGASLSGSYLAGIVHTNKGTIEKCYNIGEISAT